MNISIAQAKAHFSDLVKKAEAGEEFTLTRHGKIVARIVSAAESSDRLPRVGALRGKVWMAEDFEAPVPEFVEFQG